MDKPVQVDWRCPVYTKCVGNGRWFKCAYAKKSGTPFKFTPKCFIDKKEKRARS